jgi:hypothetical protein
MIPSLRETLKGTEKPGQIGIRLKRNGILGALNAVKGSFDILK